MRRHLNKWVVSGPKALPSKKFAKIHPLTYLQMLPRDKQWKVLNHFRSRRYCIYYVKELLSRRYCIYDVKELLSRRYCIYYVKELFFYRRLLLSDNTVCALWLVCPEFVLKCWELQINTILVTDIAQQKLSRMPYGLVL